MRDVIFRNDQKIVSGDLNNVFVFAKQFYDALVANAITNQRYFSGFEVTKTGQTEITVAAGHYWGGGPVFVRSDATAFNLLTGGAYMPVTTRRIIAVVAYGDTIETDTQERSFVIDDQGNTEPQSVAMERLRYARLALVAGTEGPSPQKPTLDAGVIPVAWLTLTTSGVLDGSIEMAETYRLPSVESLYQRANEFAAWRAAIGQILDSIQSEIARIQAALPPNLSDVLMAMLARIEALEARLTVPAGNTPADERFVDRFLSERDSDTEAVGYAAVVDNGLRFPAGVPTRVAIELNNPVDPKVKKIGNLILPAFSGETLRLSIDNPDGMLSISQYQSQLTTRVQKMLTRTVTKALGNIVVRTANPATPSLKGLFSRVDITRPEYERFVEQVRAMDFTQQMSTKFTFKRDGGEVYDVHVTHFMGGPDITWSTIGISEKAVVQEPYWEVVTKPAVFTGSQVAQTFWNATNGWLTAVGIRFGQVGGAGNVNVLITEMQGNKPAKTTIVGRGVINVANLHTNGPIRCELEEPVFTKGGRTYAVILLTTGSHFVRVRSGDKYGFGTAFHLDDNGEWQPVQNSGDLSIDLWYAQFAQTRIEVQMESLSRVGGISDLKITAATWEPEGTNLTWETQRAGKWYQISEGEYEALATNPVLVNLRMVFTGSRDLMPGVDLAQTEAELGLTTDEFTHFSVDHELGANADEVHVVYEVEGWDEAEHDLTARLIISASPVAADSSVVELDPEDTTRARITFVFTPSAMDTYAIETVGETTDETNQFVVVKRTDFAFYA